MIERIKDDARALRRHFDTWFSERSLHDGAIERAFELVIRGTRTGRRARCGCGPTSFGDDQDRVIVRSDGAPTYFAADVAYVENKVERGFERLIDPARRRPSRLRAAPQGGAALRSAATPTSSRSRCSSSCTSSSAASAPRCPSGAASSSRSTTWSTRSASTPRATSCSSARTTRRSTSTSSWRARSRPRTRSTTSSTRTRGSPRSCARRRGAGPPRRAGTSRCIPSERELIKKLLAFPAEAAEAAERRAPHRIAVYALELAQTFTAFYRDCKVVGAEPEAVESFRLAPVRRDQAHARPLARAARRLRARVDVAVHAY